MHASEKSTDQWFQLHLEHLEEEEQMKLKGSGRREIIKIRVDISEIRRGYEWRKYMKSKTFSFVNKFDKYPVRLIIRERERDRERER